MLNIHPIISVSIHAYVSRGSISSGDGIFKRTKKAQNRVASPFAPGPQEEKSAESCTFTRSGELHIDEIGDEEDDDDDEDDAFYKHTNAVKTTETKNAVENTRGGTSGGGGQGVSSRTLQAILKDQKDRQARYEQMNKDQQNNRRYPKHQHDGNVHSKHAQYHNKHSYQDPEASNQQVDQHEPSTIDTKKIQLPEGWKRIRDPETGRFYYYNRRREEMSYDHPGQKRPRPDSMAYERSMRIILEGASGADLKRQPVSVLCFRVYVCMYVCMYV